MGSLRRSAWLALVAVAILIAATSLAEAGIVVLMNGDQIRGEILDITDTEVAVKTAGGVVRIPIRNVQDVRLDSGESILGRPTRSTPAPEPRPAEDWRRPPPVAPTPPPVAAPDPAPPAEEAPLPPGAGAAAAAAPPDAAGVTLGAHYESALFGFRLRCPEHWRAAQEAPDYFTFQDLRADASMWRFSITVIEPFEASYDEVRRKAGHELDGHMGLRVLRRVDATIDGARAERTSTVYERPSLPPIRHEQVIVQTRRQSVLVMHFFLPGRGPEALPEVEAVLRTVELRR